MSRRQLILGQKTYCDFVKMVEFDYSLLKIANLPVLSQFLHDCVNDLSGLKHINFDNYNSDIEWTIDDFNRTKKSIQKFYRQCIINDNFDLSAVNLGNDIQEEIKNCFLIRKNDIYETLVKETLRDHGHTLVENIDWKLRWILGSSKLASIREPLLQIDLHCTKKGIEDDEPSQKQTINFELNLKELDVLIDQLQKVCNEVHTE